MVELPATPLRLVFFGTSDFAVPALRAVANLHTVCLVITQPDRPAGRGHTLQPTAVGACAAELALPIAKPERLKPEIDRLRQLQADAFVVVSYGRILPAELLALPPLGAFNIHPSLLPLYRGATPIAGPLRDGCSETALSIILMDAGLDTGDIVAQELTPIEPSENGSRLHDRLAGRGVDVLLMTLAQAATGRLVRTPQSGLASEAEIAATFTRPLKPEELIINWSRSAAEIVAHVRAYADKPAARTTVGDVRLKILACEARPGQSGALPGTRLRDPDGGLLIACGEGSVLLTYLIPPGRPPQRGTDFARRNPMESQL